MRLIDADSIELMDRAYSVYDPMREEWDVVISVNDIENAPTIDPVKHGHWKDVMELVRSYGTQTVIRCSECGKEQPKGSFNVPKYCCECGARMDLEVAK